MKAQHLTLTKMATLLAIFLMALTLTASAQTHKHGTKTKHSTMMQDCCMMQDGKMMVMKNGKKMSMEKDMVMKNGTVCTMTGECKMKNGKKMQMKNGDCMDMSGKMCNDKMKDMSAAMYSCPMHPEVTSAKAGKCSKCGMALVKKA